MDDLGMFAGLIAATMAIIGALKSKFKWVDGKEEALALVLPVALAVAAKLTQFTAGFAALSWTKLLIGSFIASLMAQFGHDKVLDPVVKPLIGWVSAKFTKK